MSRPSRPRVLLLVENLPVPLDRRAWQESLALHAAGWDVTVISPRGSGSMAAARQRLDGIRIYRYPQRPARGMSGYLVEYLPSMVCTLAWALVARTHGRFDVVHGCNPPDLFWTIGALAGLEGSRYVFDQHDVGPELAATKWGGTGLRGRILTAITTWLERRSYRTAALVIAPNDTYRDIAIRRGSLPPEMVVTVRNAPDVEGYRAAAAGIRPEPHRVGYVGVMNTQDGLDLLLDAWALVTAEADMADAVLELVGDGEARPELEAQAARLGLHDRVRFHGFQRPDVFVPILARCVVGISPDPPTAFNDVSTMVKVVDYLAIGRGVVAFDLAETRRVAGDAAVIAASPTAAGLAETVVRVLRDPALAERLGAAGAGRVEAIRLDWTHSAALLTEAYARLLQPSPTAA